MSYNNDEVNRVTPKSSDYLDPNFFLAEEQKIPITYNFEGSMPVHLLGHNEESGDGRFDQGKNADLPYWIALQAAYSNLVEVQMPSRYNQNMRNALNAGPMGVNLGDFNPYFYLFGFRLTADIEDNELSETLIKSFKERTKEIFNHAWAAVSRSESEIETKLDQSEMQLFKHLREQAQGRKQGLESDSLYGLNYLGGTSDLVESDEDGVHVNRMDKNEYSSFHHEEDEDPNDFRANGVNTDEETFEKSFNGIDTDNSDLDQDEEEDDIYHNEMDTEEDASNYEEEENDNKYGNGINTTKGISDHHGLYINESDNEDEEEDRDSDSDQEDEIDI